MKKMTVFYSKRTGEIKACTSGETDMGFFGSDKQDFGLIFDYIVTELDEYVLNNPHMFTVVNSEIKYIQPDIPSKFL